MQNGTFEHSPPQSTLTQNKWIYKSNQYSVINCDLKKHIAKFTDTKKMLRDNVHCNDSTEINVLGTGRDGVEVGSESKSEAKNVINLHFN